LQSQLDCGDVRDLVSISENKKMHEKLQCEWPLVCITDLIDDKKEISAL